MKRALVAAALLVTVCTARASNDPITDTYESKRQTWADMQLEAETIESRMVALLDEPLASGPRGLLERRAIVRYLRRAQAVQAAIMQLEATHEGVNETKLAEEDAEARIDRLLTIERAGAARIESIIERDNATQIRKRIR